MSTMPDVHPSLLISPTIQDATLTINFNVTIQKWCSTCHYILANLSGVASSLTSLLQVLQYVTLSHYFFRYSKNQPPTYEESNKDPEKTPRSKNKSKAVKGNAVLQPAGNISLNYTLLIKYEGNIMNPRLPVTKGIHNTKGAALCLPLLIGGHCYSTDPCGYHLQVNDPDRLPGTSNADFAPFHYWLTTSNEYFCISTSASHNANMDPSSSS